MSNKCDQCNNGFYNFPICEGNQQINILLQHLYKKLSNIFYLTFKACNCNADGSTDITCDGNGICNCKPNFKNDKCDACGPGFFNFSTCEGKKYCGGEPLQVS